MNNFISEKRVAQSIDAASSGKQVLKKLTRFSVPALFDAAAKERSWRLMSLYGAIGEITLPGDFAEFGVYKGYCAQVLTAFITGNRLLHLFDSFEGLPEDWTQNRKAGHFDLGGKVPQFNPKRTRVHKGWFRDTVPPFAAQLAQPLAFLHLDADLYSSTVEALFPLNEHIVPGTILLFDEYVYMESEDEHRALLDWAARFDRGFDYLWRTPWVQVAVRVTR
jgi:hypothetical protein